MARPRKWRKVCSLPENNFFGPMNCEQFDDMIIMTVDEYETIRLIDYQDFTQEECSQYMKIARTTVQQIYTNARKKIAQSIVDGKVLKIFGGDYQLCDGNEDFCGCRGCHKRQRYKNLDTK
ncbi:DUF134 domain-containing protein [Sedimentibacter sp. zth1]|uniref:DUF134 domain-containing protein n=1 Tax=Sedimentibacter sp. zth1 TaxID=2816908 RepID=UPI001A91965D|nr:DUF134 domain-containing protein [Sedimentibacter sp. zth1]QSX04986.1 DUF134 domain-containing protein [Sedimentibacter sp. zth1]